MANAKLKPLNQSFKHLFSEELIPRVLRKLLWLSPEIDALKNFTSNSDTEAKVKAELFLLAKKIDKKLKKYPKFILRLCGINDPNQSIKKLVQLQFQDIPLHPTVALYCSWVRIKEDIKAQKRFIAEQEYDHPQLVNPFAFGIYDPVGMAYNLSVVRSRDAKKEERLSKLRNLESGEALHKKSVIKQNACLQSRLQSWSTFFCLKYVKNSLVNKLPDKVVYKVLPFLKT